MSYHRECLLSIEAQALEAAHLTRLQLGVSALKIHECLPEHLQRHVLHIEVRPQPWDGSWLAGSVAQDIPPRFLQDLACHPFPLPLDARGLVLTAGPEEGVAQELCISMSVLGLGTAGSLGRLFEPLAWSVGRQEPVPVLSYRFHVLSVDPVCDTAEVQLRLALPTQRSGDLLLLRLGAARSAWGLSAWALHLPVVPTPVARELAQPLGCTHGAALVPRVALLQAAVLQACEGPRPLVRLPESTCGIAPALLARLRDSAVQYWCVMCAPLDPRGRAPSRSNSF